MTGNLDKLHVLDQDIEQILYNALPAEWPELNAILCNHIKKPFPPEIYLPLASCLAVCGNEKKAVHVSAAFYILILFFGIYRVSRANACFAALAANTGNHAMAYNYASVLHILPIKILTLAPLPGASCVNITNCFLKALFSIAREKETALIYVSAGNEVAQQSSLPEVKIITSACTAGALAGTDDRRLIAACRGFGFHLGKALSALNELELFPEGKAQLSGNIDTIVNLYNYAQVEWQAALHELCDCPYSAGRDILASWITTDIIDLEKKFPESER